MSNVNPSEAHMPAPCKECPFKKTALKGWLGAERMEGILQQDSFPCHKTTGGKDEDIKQCAGHMLMKGEGSTFVQLAARFGKPVQLKGQEEVFESYQDCIDHHAIKRRESHE